MLQWAVGAVRVTSVVEFEGPIPAAMFFSEATPEALEGMPWLRGWALTDAEEIILRIQALVVEADGARIVVDTCIGNDKPRTLPFMHLMQGPFLENFEAAGFAPDAIDTVVCTHLHVDHIGWNTRLVDGAWVPTFPNARYLMVEGEVEHWKVTPSNDGEIFADSVQPVIDAGLADFVTTDHAVTPSVRFEATPGHTPGHVSVHIESEGSEAVITGDLLHHPAQCGRPDWSVPFDSDAAAAVQTRREFLARYADTAVLIIGTHFAEPVVGHIKRDGDGYRFEPATG